MKWVIVDVTERHWFLLSSIYVFIHTVGQFNISSMLLREVLYWETRQSLNHCLWHNIVFRGQLERWFIELLPWQYKYNFGDFFDLLCKGFLKNWLNSKEKFSAVKSHALFITLNSNKSILYNLSRQIISYYTLPLTGWQNIFKRNL